MPRLMVAGITTPFEGLSTFSLCGPQVVMHDPWRRDGRELFFLGSADQLYAVTVNTGTTFSLGVPRPLFQACQVPRGQDPRASFMYRYDASADGKRSLWICATDTASPIVAVRALPALKAQ